MPAKGAKIALVLWEINSNKKRIKLIATQFKTRIPHTYMHAHKHLVTVSHMKPQKSSMRSGLGSLLAARLDRKFVLHFPQAFQAFGRSVSIPSASMFLVLIFIVAMSAFYNRVKQVPKK